MIDVILICLGFVFSTLFYRWVKADVAYTAKDFGHGELWDWLWENDPSLYAKCRMAYPPDEMRVILNEVTGLQILGCDTIQESEEKYLQALKEMKKAKDK